jgi:hypothetical protein
MMKIKYKTVEIRTLKGLKQAERLQRLGWTIGRTGLFSIQFYRRVS